MKLVYITNITTPAKDAQSIQVSSMAESFFEQLKDDFLFISPKNKKQSDTRYRWVKTWSLSFLPRTIRYFFLATVSFFEVLKFKPDVIYSRDIFIIFFYHFFGYRTVYEMHKPFETKIGHLIFKFLSNKIKIVSISNSLKIYIMDKYHINSVNILVAHDGFFEKDFKNLDSKICRENLLKQLSLSSDSFVAIYSGNLKVGGKGVDLIIKAARMCPEVTFILVGGESFDDGDFKNIKFIPRVSYSEVPVYLKAADLLLLPFTRELKTYKYHSALKMFEYMASGVPVLASELGSITEIFNSNNSYLFDPENTDDFVLKIKSIKDNINLARQKASQALKDSLNYTWQSRAKDIINFLIV